MSLDDPHYQYMNLGTPNHSIPFYSFFTEKPENYYIHRRKGLDQKAVYEYNENVLKKFIESFENSSTENMIISGEDISVLSKDAVFKMKNFLLEFFNDITIVAYIRSPHSYIVSSFQENVKAGISNFKDLARNYPYYRKKIEKFDEIFGISNVSIRHFDKESLYRNDVVLDFCNSLNIKFNENKLLRSNESLSLEELSLLYVYYKLGTGYGIDKNSPQQNTLLRKKLYSLKKSKFTISSNITKPLINEYKGDLQWIEDRSGITFKEITSSNKTDISTEEDIENIAISMLDSVIALVNPNYLPSDLEHKDKREQVVTVMHALKLQENNMPG